jgi:hypothetical protein
MRRCEYAVVVRIAQIAWHRASVAIVRECVSDTEAQRLNVDMAGPGQSSEIPCESKSRCVEGV